MEFTFKETTNIMISIGQNMSSLKIPINVTYSFKNKIVLTTVYSTNLNVICRIAKTLE